MKNNKCIPIIEKLTYYKNTKIDVCFRRISVIDSPPIYKSLDQRVLEVDLNAIKDI